MKNNNFSKVLTFGILPLLLLPACDLFKSNTGASLDETPAASGTRVSGAVIEFNGKPEITAQEFKDTIFLFMQAQPQLEQLLPILPREQIKQMFRQIAEGLRNEREIVKEVHALGLDNTAEYLKQEKQVMDAVKRDLAVRTYQNSILKEASISEADARKYYDENRAKPVFKRPPFMKSMGGVTAEIVTVNTEKEAKDLAEQAKSGNLDAAAKAAKKNVTKLDDVSFQTPNVDAALRNKLMTIKQFPTVDHVKGNDGKFYVFKAVKKTDEAFANFDEVKEQVKEVMSGERFNETLTQRIAQLNDKYKAEINDAVLDQIINEFLPTAAVPAESEETEAEEKPRAQQA